MQRKCNPEAAPWGFTCYLHVFTFYIHVIYIFLQFGYRNVNKCNKTRNFPGMYILFAIILDFVYVFLQESRPT